MKTSNILALIVLGVIVFCVGGAAIIGSFLPDPKTTGTAASQQEQPLIAVPATSVAATTPDPTEPVQPIVDTTTAPRHVAPTTRRSVPKPNRTTTRPKPKPTKTTRPPSTQSGVHPGAFCSPEGALGHTSKGTLMRCTFKSGDTRARWRAA